jgi:1-acyl-sn-glycerol-3-phosphate acyltransferase
MRDEGRTDGFVYSSFILQPSSLIPHPLKLETPMTNWLNTIWYEFCRLHIWAGLTFGFSLRFEGGRNIPDEGPALLIGNHESFLDPIAVGLTTQRQLCYLARKTLFTPSFGWFLRSVNCVPVDQEGVAKEGLKTILHLLGQGRAVLVFPEGERTLTGRINPFKPGVQLLIKRAQAPIIPVGIAGAFDAYPRGKALPRPAPLFMPAGKGTIAVSVGKPLDGKYFASLPREEMLVELQKAIQAQKDQAEHLRRK